MTIRCQFHVCVCCQATCIIGSSKALFPFTAPDFKLLSNARSRPSTTVVGSSSCWSAREAVYSSLPLERDGNYICQQIVIADVDASQALSSFLAASLCHSNLVDRLKSPSATCPRGRCYVGESMTLIIGCLQQWRPRDAAREKPGQRG